jgi:hypothetical protein
MKMFALAIVVIAFGALMVAGCPAANNTSTNKAPTNAPTNAPENK